MGNVGNTCLIVVVVVVIVVDDGAIFVNCDWLDRFVDPLMGVSWKSFFASTLFERKRSQTKGLSLCNLH
jgi:hypothetical protein